MIGHRHNAGVIRLGLRVGRTETPASGRHSASTSLQAGDKATGRSPKRLALRELRHQVQTPPSRGGRRSRTGGVRGHGLLQRGQGQRRPVPVPLEDGILTGVDLLAEVFPDPVVVQRMEVGGDGLAERAGLGPGHGVGRQQGRDRVDFLQVFEDRGRLRDDPAFRELQGRHQSLRVQPPVGAGRQGRDGDVFIGEPLQRQRDPDAFTGRVAGLGEQPHPVQPSPACAR